jgi:predicted secreted Zn-dependent protease
MFCTSTALAVGLPLAAHCGALEWPAEKTVAAGVSVTVPTSCKSSVRLVERTRNYEFFGARPSDADQDFRARLLTASDHSGRLQRFAGQTDWNIEWQTCLERRPDSCRIAGVELTVNVVYTLPRWADRDWTTREVKARWDRYARNLAEHERGHGQIALQVANAIEADLVGQGAESCVAIDAEAVRRIGVQMHNGEAMQNEYDRATQHGVTQGASFPFP